MGGAASEAVPGVGADVPGALSIDPEVHRLRLPGQEARQHSPDVPGRGDATTALENAANSNRHWTNSHRPTEIRARQCRD